MVSFQFKHVADAVVIDAKQEKQIQVVLFFVSSFVLFLFRLEGVPAGFVHTASDWTTREIRAVGQ